VFRSIYITTSISIILRANIGRTFTINFVKDLIDSLSSDGHALLSVNFACKVDHVNHVPQIDNSQINIHWDNSRSDLDEISIVPKIVENINLITDEIAINFF